MKRNILTIVISIILIASYLIMYYDYGVVYSSPDSFTLANVAWGSLDNPRKAYPGSSKILLYIELINNNNFTLQSVTGNLSLPSGFQDIDGDNIATSTGISYKDDTVVRYVEPGRTFQFSFTISIDSSLAPGTYYGNLSIFYTYLNASIVENATYSIPNIQLKVSNFPTFNIELKHIEWLAGGEHVNASAGSRGLTLSIELFNNASESIDSLTGYLNLTDPFYPDVSSVSLNSIGPNTRFTLDFNDIGIEYDATPGLYDVKLTLKYTFRGYGNAVKDYEDIMVIHVVVGEPDDAGVAFVKAYWEGNNRVYPGSRDVYLNMEFENVGRYQLNNLIIKSYLPKGFKNQSGGSLVKMTYSGVIGYGDFFTISIGPLYISESAKTGVRHINVSINGYASYNGADIMVSESIRISVVLNKYKTVFEVAQVSWKYNGRPAIALPDTRDITLAIDIAYRGEYDISGLSLNLSMPDGFKIKSVSIPNGRVAPSTVFSVNIVLDIDDDVSPGNYSISLVIGYTVSPENQNAIYSSNITLSIEVSDPKVIDSNIIISNAYWGINNPQTVYPGSQNNPLSIVLLNDGGYDIEGVTILFVSLPEGLSAYPTNVTVSSYLSAGSFTSTVAYMNISDSIDPGTYVIGLNITYEIRIYGSVIHHSLYKELDLVISQPIFSKPYIKVYNYGWSNNYKVYPGTENAMLSVSMVNDGMYSVSAIHINVSGGDGIKVGNGSNFFYISGPVNSWGTYNLNIRLDVDENVAPGYHSLDLRLRYVLNSGGRGYPMDENIIIQIYISPLKGIEYVMHTWMGQSPGPGSAGVTLLLIYRNNEIDEMKGLYASIEMPEGFISADTGSNVFKVTPITASSLSDLMNLISGGIQGGVLSSIPSSSEVYKGDYIALPARLIISPDVSIGHYDINITFNFLDQWDSIHEVELTSDFRLPGAVEYIDVIESQSYLQVGEKEANVSITLRNPGYAPIYDVYVGVASYTQTVIFSSSIKHLQLIGPGENVELSWRASVNPKTSLTGSMPILITISYVDPLGYRRTLNQTAVVYVVGLAKLKLIDLEVSTPVYSGSEFSISATIVNIGTDTAKYTEVSLNGEAIETTPDSYSFLGDIDVSYQFPFTVYAIAGNETGLHTIYLTIKFYDIYNKEYTVNYPIKIEIVEYKPSEAGRTPIQGFIEDYWRIGVFIAVILFLIGAGFMIYRLTRGARLSGA